MFLQVLSWLVVPFSIPFFPTNELLKNLCSPKKKRKKSTELLIPNGLDLLLKACRKNLGSRMCEYLLNNHISCICTKKSENISITRRANIVHVQKVEVARRPCFMSAQDDKETLQALCFWS